MTARTKTKTARKKSQPGRIKTINLKRETIRNLSGREQKRVKGGGGARSGVVMES